HATTLSPPTLSLPVALPISFLPAAPGAPPQARPILNLDECVVRVWDVKTGRELSRLKGHDEKVVRVGCSPDGRFVVSQEMNGPVDRKRTRLNSSHLVISYAV